jgi:PIN domain nuclease of toxin-antitoxin system
MSDLLLDTCAVLWLAEGIEMAADARRAVADSNLNVSPISAWEIANLVRKNRIALAMPIVKWFRQKLDLMQAATPELTLEILAGCANYRVLRRPTLPTASYSRQHAKPA